MGVSSLKPQAQSAHACADCGIVAAVREEFLGDMLEISAALSRIESAIVDQSRGVTAQSKHLSSLLSSLQEREG